MKSRNWCQKERRLLHGSIIFIAWRILARHMFQQENMRETNSKMLALEIKMHYWILILAKKSSRVIYWIFFPVWKMQADIDFWKVIYLFILFFSLPLYLGIANTRNLETLSLYVHKSPRHLKERAGKRTYIRPLQKDLDLTPLEEDEFVVRLWLFMYC